jgi:DNA-binding IscR family transcriptional regulator
MLSYMKRDSRLSGVLHVLLHMAEHDGPVTSEVLARAMTTNPVVIRRILAGLREHGYVQSEKGHGGGWSLARDLGSVTLRDIYIALGCPSLLAIGNRTESPGCVVEQAVNAALGESFDAAEAFLLARFGEVTLASLSASVRASHTTESHHDPRRHHHRGRAGRTAGSARARART